MISLAVVTRLTTHQRVKGQNRHKLAYAPQYRSIIRRTSQCCCLQLLHHCFMERNPGSSTAAMCANWNSSTCDVFEESLMLGGRKRTEHRSTTNLWYSWYWGFSSDGTATMDRTRFTHEWWQTTQDHLLQWTITTNQLLWWPKKAFQGLSEGQFEEVWHWAQWTRRPSVRQVWVAFTLQRLSTTLWSQSDPVSGSEEKSANCLLYTSDAADE